MTLRAVTIVLACLVALPAALLFLLFFSEPGKNRQMVWIVVLGMLRGPARVRADFYHSQPLNSFAIAPTSRPIGVFSGGR